VDYQDPALMRSYLEESKVACAALFSESVADQVKRSSAALEFIHELTTQLEGSPVEVDEQSDDFGRSISGLTNSTLEAMIDFRDGPLAGVQQHGVEVPNVEKLDEHIAQWQAVKVNLVDCWPYADAPLPPADREMIAASRAALQAGERGESLEAVIARRRSK
jgi:hypothetical protein